MPNFHPARKRKIKFPFYNVRHISNPEDLDNDRRIYVGNVPITAVVDLDTGEDVRDYLLDAEGRKRRRPTQVHRAIQDTLENNPADFSVLNSGVTVVARACEIDEKNKWMLLTGASIINGSQTQGVIRDFLESLGERQKEDGVFIPNVKFEVIVTQDEDLIAEVSIARNFQIDVMTLSIAGRRGQLKELEESFQAKRPGVPLQQSETQLSEDYVKTERLLQIIAALIPEELWIKPGEMNKVYTYSMKAKCLKDFQEIYVHAHTPSDPEFKKYKELYQFYLDICADAQDLYEKWKTHHGFAGTGLHSIEREGRTIKDVPDGIVFPILSALSAFAKKTRSGWKIDPPPLFSDDELISAAKFAYINIAQSNPWNMGKSKACYSTLHQITQIYKKLSASMQ
jgi:hypothetical protein